MPPCLTLSIIWYGSRVKWRNTGKGVVPSPTPWCNSYRKGSLRVTLDYGRLLYLLLYIYLCICMWIYMYICMCLCIFLYVCVFVCTCMYVCMYISVCLYVSIFVFVCVYMYVCVYVCIHIYIYIHIYMYCPVSWGCRIHWLHLWRGVRPPPNECPGYMTLNNLMVRFQQCWSFGECRVLPHCHHSQVHFGPEW